MKALSIRSDYAMLIATGFKTIEVRTWRTDYRGDIVICSNAKKIKDTIPGHALCVARIADIVVMRKKHCKDAAMRPSDFYPDTYFAWMLEDVRLIEPVPVKGKLSLWNYDGAINYLPVGESEEKDDELFDKYWQPLIV